jgi:thiol:disulfide interchange protein
MKKSFFSMSFLLVFLLSSQLFAVEMTTKLDSYSYKSGSEAFLPITIEIPETGYIYGNPKGPGTGKPLSITISGAELTTDEIYITKPEKYESALSGDWVWSHKENTTVLLPLNKLVLTDKPITISFDALFCDESTCTPYNGSINVIINEAETNSSELILTVSEKYQTLIVTNQQTENVSTSTNTFEDISLSPQFIDKQNINAILPAILAAFIAGLILNVMPCVLPVISIKVMSLIKMHNHSRGELALHGVMYTAGVIVSFIILASLAAFAGANWGALFQSRGFIIAMSVIIFSLALSMLGVYTLQTPQFISSIAPQSSVITTSFLNGLLATILATPCSGPFLGATLTWTLTQPAIVIFTVFISIGFGLAFPFLLLSLFPKLIQKIPKGGNWSLITEKLLGFFLAGSVIYFLSTLSEKHILYTLVILLFTTIGLWQFGQLYTPIAEKKTRRISLTGLIALVTVGIITANFFFLNDSQNEPEKVPFNYDQLVSHVENNQVVFIQFTADWCPNCAYLESTVLHTDQIKNLMENNDIVYMKADLTEAGSAGEFFLEKLGSRSIPFAAVFHPDDFNKPYALRDMFTKDDLTVVLEQAKKSEGHGNSMLLEPLSVE